MTWSYRVLHAIDPVLKDDTYSIHEVYYDEDGKPESCSKYPCGTMGETLDELRACYDMMAEAFTKPVLEYDQFGKRA